MKLDGLRVYHLVAKIDRPDVSLVGFDVGSWVWERLRAAFPAALGACLMPNHPHLVAALADPDEARIRLNRLLGQLARKLGLRFLGEAAEPTLITSPQKLLRDLRYVALNPTRAGLVDDPLAWWFSTHRDVLGAVVDPWVDTRRLARALGHRSRGFAIWYHGFVSADPSVRVDGTPMPKAATPTAITRLPLARIARAVAASTRARPEAIRSTGVCRDLFVALAREQGWRSTSALASACACSTRAIQRSATHLVDLEPARLCLGDARLLRGVPRWQDSRLHPVGIRDERSA